MIEVKSVGKIFMVIKFGGKYFVALKGKSFVINLHPCIFSRFLFYYFSL